MKNILDTIVNEKYTEVAKQKQQTPLPELEKSRYFSRETISLKERLTGGKTNGIIAEFKRRSPSAGIINSTADIAEVTNGYSDAGCAGISVLTDTRFFGGSIEDLQNIRNNLSVPLLRKDFIIDSYQVAEAKSAGADVILLIASVLDKDTIDTLTQYAHDLNLEILFEVHNTEDLQKLNPDIDLVGINNRDLNTFATNTDISKQMLKHLPDTCLPVAESGIHSAKDLLELKASGFRGFLIGTGFMKAPNPADACFKFVNTIKENAQS